MNDLEWNGTDIVVGVDGDLSTVSGSDNIEQSLAILVRDEIGSIVGDTITAPTLAEAEDAISKAIERDPQVTGIRSLSITEINKQEQSITIKAETSEDDTFVSEVTV